MVDRPNAKTPNSRPGDRVVEADFSFGATNGGQFPPPITSEIAFAGRTNVGKSSLMNSLMQGRGLVRTSGKPGCTRQVSWFSTTSDDGARIDLVDLPGYGYAKRSKGERNEWAILIEHYLLERPTLRGVVVLIDVRRGVEPDDLELVEMLEGPSRTSRKPLQITVAATKLDKLSRAAQKPALAELTKALGRPLLGYSAVDGTGRDVLWRRVRKIAGVGETSDNDS